MIHSKNTPAPHKDRWQAVHIHQLYPGWNARKIAHRIGRSHGFVIKWLKLYQQHGTVSDQPRSGRPSKVSAEAVHHALTAAQLQTCKTSAAIAKQVRDSTGIKLAARTIRSLLRKNGLRHLRPKVVPILRAAQKQRRLKFAKQALRTELVSWRRVMITDSCIFRLGPRGRPAGHWCTQATRGSIGKAKHSHGVHVYMGMTWWGVTKLMFVTGTHKQVSKYTNPNTGQLYTRVGSLEYTDVLEQLFVPEGNRLFQHAGKWANNWQLQQDNAPAHKTKRNLDYIAANVPGGAFLEWPSNSPDLSPIENLWEWMQQQLELKGQCSNTDELKARLIEIRDSITPQQLQPYFTGMRRRMELVIERSGGHIGK